MCPLMWVWFVFIWLGISISGTVPEFFPCLYYPPLTSLPGWEGPGCIMLHCGFEYQQTLWRECLNGNAGIHQLFPENKPRGSQRHRDNSHSNTSLLITSTDKCIAFYPPYHIFSYEVFHVVFVIRPKELITTNILRYTPMAVWIMYTMAWDQRASLSIVSGHAAVSLDFW